jgi:hypothetical protein
VCPWESAKDDKIESRNNAIDRPVYELYGLTEAEVQVVVGKE